MKKIPHKESMKRREFLLEKMKNIDKTLVKITKGEKPEIISQIFIRFLQKKIRKCDVSDYNK